MIGRTSAGSSVRPTAVWGDLVGFGLAAWLLHRYGLTQVLEVLARIGAPAMCVILLVHLPQMLFSALGWRAIAAGGPPRPGISTYLRLRWIREGVNNLLPLAQIGGELVAARLLQRRSVPLAAAIGGTVADLMLEIATQVLFTLLGAVLLVQLAGHTEVSALLIRGLVIAALVVAAAFVALWLGVAGVLERAVLNLGRSLGWPATARIGGLHDALSGCFRSPGRVSLAAVWHLLSWLLGGVEVCLILHFFGHDIGLGSATIIESLGQAAKALGFAVPAAIGVQEGGYVLICTVFGIAPELAIALSLVKRLREVVLGIPGLILWHRA